MEKKSSNEKIAVQTFTNEVVESVKAGGIAVISTDTLYGIVCSAFFPESVEKVYELKKRDTNKACIVLISDVSDLKKFSINLPPKFVQKIKEFWPGPNSLIFLCDLEKFKHLHRGTNQIAFRVPADENLREFLKQTGPIIAPSANLEGFPPAKNIAEAKKYFGENVDFCVDGGVLEGNPSRLIRFNGDEIEYLR